MRGDGRPNRGPLPHSGAPATLYATSLLQRSRLLGTTYVFVRATHKTLYSQITLELLKRPRDILLPAKATPDAPAARDGLHYWPGMSHAMHWLYSH